MPKSQGFREMCRDVLGCVFVILVSILVYFTDSEVAKYIDPVFAIISSISLFVLCYPYSMYIYIYIYFFFKQWHNLKELINLFLLSIRSERIRFDFTANDSESYQHR